RAGCYARVGEGSGLAAQNALFALGALQRDELRKPGEALATFRAYLRRFPDGALAPEAAFACAELLASLSRLPEAIAELEAYRAAYPADPRSARAAVLEARWSAALGRVGKALALYDGVVGSPAP